MRKWFTEFFYYSRGERRGILVLLGIKILLEHLGILAF